MPTNKFGQTPKDIICSKSTNSSSELISLINSLFEESFYVSVYRDEERGDVLVDRPSPKIILNDSLNPLSTDISVISSDSKLISGVNIENNLSPLNNKLITTVSNINQSKKKLAAYVGPVSTSAVSNHVCFTPSYK